MIPVKDLEDGKKIITLFAALEESDKNLVIGYLSALNDKQVRDREKQTKLAAV